MKKMANRFLSVIFALIMVMSMVVVSVSADENENAEFSVSVSGNVAVGEEITVLIAIKNAEAVDSAAVDIQYNSACMELVEIIETNSRYYTVVGGEVSAGLCKYGFMFSKAYSGDINVTTLILKVLSVENTEIALSATEWDADETGPADVVFSLRDTKTDDALITSLYYEYKIENGEVTITDCDLDMRGDVIIPDTIEGYSVTAIGDNAFSGCDEITSIVIPDSVKIIEQFAFSGCDGLLSATIGSGVTTLGRNIFWSCKNLESVIIKDGVTSISQEMFLQCGKLKTVSIPESVTTIGEKAFQFCYLLEDIKLPSELTKIESCTFYSCENLKSVVIPDSVTKICDNAFYGCEDLANVKLPKNLAEIEYNAFAGCGLTSIDIPEGVTSIGNAAFSGTKIKSVVIPSSVTVLSDSIFRNCDNLKEITIPKTVKIINPFAFCDCDSLQEVVIPANVTEIWGQAFGYETGFTPKGITIYGVKGSAAQTYAENNWYATFVELKDIDFNFDVNGDGDITAADARLALRASAMLDELTGLAALAADVDSNGYITAADARKILRKSAGLE